MRLRAVTVLVLALAVLPAGARANVTLEWVGDIALSSDRGLPPGGLSGALRPVARPLHGADLLMGNLEGTLATRGASKCGAGSGGGRCFAFRAP